MSAPRRIRLARPEDVEIIEIVQRRALRELSIGYGAAQIAAVVADLAASNRELVRDRTYYVCAQGGRLLGCGGWSRRAAEYGAGGALLDPARDLARVRAVFVDPDHARTGVGRALVRAAEAAAIAAGFQGLTLLATPAGVGLYARLGYRAAEQVAVQPRPGVVLPMVRMVKPSGRGVARAA